MSKLSGSSFRWFSAMILLVVSVAFSSCSTNKKTSLAYLDDIYKPYDVNYLMTYYNEQGGVSDQDASVIKPYRPTVPDYYPYTKPINFSMSFGIGSYNPYYGYGNGNYCRPYGYYPAYYSYYMGNYRGCYSSAWYALPYTGSSYSYYPGNYGYGNDYGSPPGGSYVYGNNVSYFHGINSSERYNSSGINYSKYVYYRASGASEVINTGRQSGSSGKSRYTNVNKSTNKSNNLNNSSNYNSNRSYQSSPSGRSSSPSRSSGSSGGSYTGKRPR